MMELKIERIVNGPFKQNCYIISGNNASAIIIDPGSEFNQISDYLGVNGLRPTAVLNTHGHFDHIGAVAALVKRYDIPFYLHSGDAALVKSANLYRFLFKVNTPIEVPKVDILLTGEENRMVIGGYAFDVISTPGHTSGSLCFQIEGALFSGDTLMPWGPGVTNLPGGDAEALKQSIEKLKLLPSDIIVYSGHGRPLIIEKIWNRC